MDWQDQLIAVYLFVCKEYEQELSHYIARLSNYSDLGFSDEEVITIYLFGIMSGHSRVKAIYGYTARHLKDWFPALPSYVAFIQRLNKLSHLFEVLVSKLVAIFGAYQEGLPLLMDSLPIILAHRGRRFKACVAREIASSNGYCATKKLHYYGVKLHFVGKYKVGSLPIPVILGTTEAGRGDIKVLEDIQSDMPEGSRLFADKAYQTGNEPVADKKGFTLLTPVKKQKGQDILDSADRLLSSAISSVRQPVESFFNWIEEKTKIQIASKVRSFEGLMVHIYGKLAAAFFILQSSFCS